MEAIGPLIRSGCLSEVPGVLGLGKLFVRVAASLCFKLKLAAHPSLQLIFTLLSVCLNQLKKASNLAILERLDLNELAVDIERFSLPSRHGGPLQLFPDDLLSQVGYLKSYPAALLLTYAAENSDR